MFAGSVILSEVWTRKSCVTSDLKAEYKFSLFYFLINFQVQLSFITLAQFMLAINRTYWFTGRTHPDIAHHCGFFLQTSRACRGSSPRRRMGRAGRSPRPTGPGPPRRGRSLSTQWSGRSTTTSSPWITSSCTRCWARAALARQPTGLPVPGLLHYRVLLSTYKTIGHFETIQQHCSTCKILNLKVNIPVAKVRVMPPSKRSEFPGASEVQNLCLEESALNTLWSLEFSLRVSC